MVRPSSFWLPQAVKQISASFKDYTSVPHIAQVWRRVQELQERIRALLDVDFDALYVYLSHPTAAADGLCHPS
jgi:hypothetical protein